MFSGGFVFAEVVQTELFFGFNSSCDYLLFGNCVSGNSKWLSNPLFSRLDQICAGAVQRPLLANVWPSHAGPAVMSPHSLCGAQPDVQLHHEHAVAEIYKGEGGCEGKHFRHEKSHNSKGWGGGVVGGGVMIKTEEKLQGPVRRSTELDLCNGMGLNGWSELRRSHPPSLLLAETVLSMTQRRAHSDKGIKKQGEPDVVSQLMNVREWQIACPGM